jgi:DNA-binding winged helix-turn-helix (wHTH) protein/TolB-like protein
VLRLSQSIAREPSIVYACSHRSADFREACSAQFFGLLQWGGVILQFGTFEFDDQSLELRKAGRLVALEPQPARALATLLRRADEVVSRDDLRRAVWGPDTHVDFDRGLSYCLSAIRQALGDKGENPRFVQTLPKRGYCFIAPVRVAAERPSAESGPGAEPPAGPGETPPPPPTLSKRQWLRVTGFALVALLVSIAWFASRRPAAPGPTVIAVSVFDNETGEPNYDRVMSNLTDSVVANLTALAPGQIEVIGNAEPLRRPRNIRDLKALSASIRADYVLLAQLQRSDPGLRVVTHVVKLPEETHLRAQLLRFGNGDEAALERAVVAEFERCVREYVLAPQ